MAQIIIDINPNGHAQTKFKPGNDGSELSTIHIGIALASATRVLALSFADILNLNKSHVEQIEAQIAEVYNNDLAMGDFGEEKSTKLRDFSK